MALRAARLRSSSAKSQRLIAPGNGRRTTANKSRLAAAGERGGGKSAPRARGMEWPRAPAVVVSCREQRPGASRAGQRPRYAPSPHSSHPSRLRDPKLESIPLQRRVSELSVPRTPDRPVRSPRSANQHGRHREPAPRHRRQPEAQSGLGASIRLAQLSEGPSPPHSLVRSGFCVTSITGPNGGAELYER